MRISKEEIETLKNAILSKDKKAEVYLFGSRLDDKKRGGDIDILIKGDLTISDILDIRLEFFKKFGEQKIDIVIYNENDPFSKYIINKAKKL